MNYAHKSLNPLCLAPFWHDSAGGLRYLRWFRRRVWHTNGPDCSGAKDLAKIPWLPLCSAAAGGMGSSSFRSPVIPSSARRSGRTTRADLSGDRRGAASPGGRRGGRCERGSSGWTWPEPRRGVHRRNSGGGPASEPGARRPLPGCGRGNVYVLKESRVLVRVVGQAPPFRTRRISRAGRPSLDPLA
jgi:hypothetical protein